MTLVQPLAVFADTMTPSNAFAVNPDYLIGSSSNANLYSIATMELSDEDYGIAPASSLGSVTNTVDYSGVDIWIHVYDKSTGQYRFTRYSDVDSNGHFYYDAGSDNYIERFIINLNKKAIPQPGTYSFSFDYTSDFTYDTSAVILYTLKNYSNAESVNTSDALDIVAQYGDVYVRPFNVAITSLDQFNIVVFPSGQLASVVGGYLDINFTRSSGNAVITTAGTNTSAQDYQSGVSGSLSDISSSIGDMSSSMDSAAESLEYISTSQNLIIQGIDNVIMHISDQLYAFWDQLYNLIHEPTYARLGDILDAIRNLDLEITVEMTEVTNSINKMNQEVQNKLQNVQQTITQGFDNSVMESEASKLDDSISEYDEAEQSVIQNVNDSLNDFEFDAELGEYQSIVSVVSDFLQQLYESSGGFKVLINLSMLLSLAGIVIGIYRFGGGS